MSDDPHQAADAGTVSVPPSTADQPAKPKRKPRSKPPVERQGLRIAEYCEAHGISRYTVWRAIKAGKLRAKKIGRCVIIPIEDGPR